MLSYRRGEQLTYLKRTIGVFIAFLLGIRDRLQAVEYGAAAPTLTAFKDLRAAVDTVSYTHLDVYKRQRSRDRDDESRARGEANFAHRKFESGRTPLFARVVGDRSLRLRHADEQSVFAEVVDFLEVFFRLVGEDHSVRSVYLRRDGLDLLLRREFFVVEVMEAVLDVYKRQIQPLSLTHP